MISFVLLVCILFFAFSTTVSAIVEQNPVYIEGALDGKEDALRDTVVTVPLRDGVYGE